jgi:uncharacterized protein (DUF849 family)
MLTVCVNGPRTPADHPALPADPAVLARDAAQAIAAGADEVHLHPKDASGRDSLRPVDVRRWVRAFRDELPGVPLGVTTGIWATGGADARLAQVGGWRVQPDLASLNWHEDGADELAACLRSQGIGIEAGLWTVPAARAWASSPHAASCRRILVEVPDLPEDQVRPVAEGILTVIEDARRGIPVLLHGEERSAWPAVLLARQLGLDTRIGLEDTLTRLDGSPAVSNTELVVQCRELLGT